MSSLMPHPTKKIKRFPCHALASFMAIAALLCSLVLVSATSARAEDVKNAWLSISLDTLVHDDLLWQPHSVQSLERFLHQRAVDFGTTLANRLTSQRPGLALRLLPTAPDTEHWRLRDEGEKNSLLISIDIDSDYGLVAGGKGSVWLTALSSFWAEPPKLFTFALRSQATLNVTLFDRSGQRQPLLDEIKIPLEEQVDCDFFAAGDSAAEWDRLTDLTDTLLPQLIEQLLTRLEELPADLTSRQEPSTTTAFPFLARVISDQGQGSAFVISRRGFAITSLHVIKDAEWLTMELSNGRKLAAFVVQRLPAYDLAILSFPHRNEKPAEFAEDGGLLNGHMLNVIGFPTATPTVTAARFQGREKHQRTEVIKVSAALEPGYSGGPVLDGSGRVIGMVISRATDQPDTGYVIPATTLRTAVAPWRDLPRAHWARTRDGLSTGKD